MQIEFRFLNERFQGATKKIEPRKKYTVGNSFDNDIFIPNSEQGSLEGKKEVYFEFYLDGNMVIFSKIASPMQTIDETTQERNSLVDSTPIAVPTLFEFDDTLFVLCSASDKPEKWTQFIKSISKNNREIADKVLDANNISPNATELKQEPVVAAKEDIKLFDDSKNEEKEIDYKYSTGMIGLINQLDKIPAVANSNRYQSFKNSLSNFLMATEKVITLFFLKLTRTVKIALIGIVAVFIVLVCVYFITNKYLGNKNEKEIATHSLENLQAIKQTINTLPSKYSYLRSTTTPGGKVILEGIVKNDKDIEYLKQKFSKYSSNKIELKLQPADTIISQIKQILDSQNLKFVRAKFDEDRGRILLTGLVNDMSSINDAELNITNQIPEVGDIDVTAVYAISDVEKDVSYIESKNKLPGRVAVTKDWNTMTIEFDGYLTKEELFTLNTDINDFASRYSNIFNIKVKISDSFASLPFKISQVSTGSPGMIVTDDGRKVFEGGEIEGMRVDKITNNEIVFSGKFPLVLHLSDIQNQTEMAVKPKSSRKTDSSSDKDDSRNSDSNSKIDADKVDLDKMDIDKRDWKEGKDSKDSKDLKDSKDSKDQKDPKESKALNDLRKMNSLRKSKEFK